MSCEGADTQIGPRQAAGEGVKGQSMSGAWHSLVLSGGGDPGSLARGGQGQGSPCPHLVDLMPTCKSALVAVF